MRGNHILGNGIDPHDKFVFEEVFNFFSLRVEQQRVLSQSNESSTESEQVVTVECSYFESILNKTITHWFVGRQLPQEQTDVWKSMVMKDAGRSSQQAAAGS